MKCEGCPANCLGQTAGFAAFCEWWASGDPTLRKHVVNRSALGVDPGPVPAREEPTPDPVPRSRWPLAVALVAWLARPGDRGVGDTVARVIRPIGGDAWKAWYREATGHDCGCGDRQAALNAAYPYG